MADISKITLLNGNQYDLKDTTARRSVIGYVASSSEVIAPYQTDADYKTGFIVWNYTNRNLNAAVAIYDASNHRRIATSATVRVYNINSYRVWNTDIITNRSLTRGIYLCELYDDIITFYLLTPEFPKYVIDQLKSIQPETMENVKTILSKYGLDTTTVYTEPTADTATADGTIVQ